MFAVLVRCLMNDREREIKNGWSNIRPTRFSLSALVQMADEVDKYKAALRNKASDDVRSDRD